MSERTGEEREEAEGERGGMLFTSAHAERESSRRSLVLRHGVRERTLLPEP